MRPTDEWQRRYKNGVLGYDTNSCTDFSCMNSIELQIQRMLRDGELPDETVSKMLALGYMDENGVVNFSDWFNAITAGTTNANGNTLYATWDAVRNFGVLPQSKGYEPNSFTNVNDWFATKPTVEQYTLAKQFLTMFDVKYEWVAIGTLNQWGLVTTHLKQAPLHVLLPTGSTWNNPFVTVPTPTYQGVNHAVTVIAQNDNVSHSILDHYNPFVKSLEWGYYIPYILKGVVTVKAPVVVESFHYTFGANLRYGAPSSFEVNQLQKGLAALGYMNKGVIGPYGPQTKAALGLFQTANHITDPEGQGTNFGPKSRDAMNRALLALP